MIMKTKKVAVADAIRIMGEDRVIGPAHLAETFRFKPEDNPPIPFSVQKLEKAAEREQVLRLSWDILPDGRVLSGSAMNAVLSNRQQNGEPLIHYCFNPKDPVITQEFPLRRWRLVSEGVQYLNKNFLEQTDLMAEEVLQDDPNVSPHLRWLAREWQKGSDRASIQRLWPKYDAHWQIISAILASSPFVQYSRDTLSERWQYMLVVNVTTGRRLHEKEWYWTRSRASDGSLVLIGRLAFDGADVDGGGPGYSDGSLGVSFSCGV